jgi:hypothetical protein
MEVNATAGQPGTSDRFTLTARDSHLRVNGGPGRTATVTNVDGGTLRVAPVDHEGAGVFANLPPGASQVVGENDRAYDFICQDGIATPVFVAISAATS